MTTTYADALRCSAGFLTCCIGRFQRARLFASHIGPRFAIYAFSRGYGFRVHSCPFVVAIQNRTKSNKTERKCQGHIQTSSPFPSTSALGPDLPLGCPCPSALKSPPRKMRPLCVQNAPKIANVNFL